ncbi:MAG: exodeoxyribonuclease VII small subunit [Endozoicomonas sp. (ex Botrylloides leachii)]|nr:exodeoxyribonuclease VII small subunit [Endozoicomonas sp. (ex Botrylloides leachii)]
MANKKNAAAFEHSLNALESLVQQMESGDLSLEDSLKAFEKGVKLARECQEALSSAEQKVHTLMEKNGKIDSQPFAQLDEEKQ